MWILTGLVTHLQKLKVTSCWDNAGGRGWHTRPPETLLVTLRDLEAEKLAEVETEALGDTLAEGDADGNTLAETLGEVEAETLGDTLPPGDADANKMAETLGEVEAETLAEVEAETLGDTLAEGDADADANKMADTLGEVEAETPTEVEAETLGETLAEGEVSWGCILIGPGPTSNREDQELSFVRPLSPRPPLINATN